MTDSNDHDESSASEPTPKEKRARVVVALPERRELSAAHREHLHGSGLSDETIELARLYTEKRPAVIASMLGWKAWRNGEGLIFPFFLPGRDEPVMARVRPTKPRTTGPKGKLVKYEQPKDVNVAPYFPPRARKGGWLRDVARPLLVVEGEKKALLLDQLGFATVGGTGVSAFHDADLRHETGSWRLAPLLLQHATVAGRALLVVFDSDIVLNDQVQLAERRFAGMALAAGAASVRGIRIPMGENGEKLGIDDYFAKFGQEATRALLEHGAVDIEPLPIDEPFVPLNGPRATREAPIDPQLRMPDGYHFGANGQLFQKSEKEGAVDTLVLPRPLLIGRVLVDFRTHRENLELTFPREGVWRTVSVERAVACSARRIVDELAAVGAPVDSGNASAAVLWMRDLESVNERRLPRVLCSTRCGWHEIDGERAFVLGASVVGTEKSVVFNDSAHHGRLTTALKPKGDTETHLDTLARAWDESRIAATAIAASLAAPLLDIIGIAGFAVHLAGDSSRGKSSMQRIAASIYGNPRSSDWIAKWDSTHVGLEQRAAALCDLPLCLDESSLVPKEQAQQAVYMLIDGTGRTRGARTGGLRETSMWRTVVLSTGERGLVDEEAHTGAQVRVLQLDVAGFGELDSTGVDALTQACAENYGGVGQMWLKAIAAEDPAKLRAAYRDLAKFALSKIKSGNAKNLDARRVDFLAALGLAEALASKHFGFGNLNGATMLSWADARFERERRTVDTLSARSLEIARELWTSHRRAFGTVGWNEMDEVEVVRPGFGPVTLGYRHKDALHFVPGPLKSELEKRGIDGSTAIREWARQSITRANEPARGTNRVRLEGSLQRFVTFDWSMFAPDESDGFAAEVHA